MEILVKDKIFNTYDFSYIKIKVSVKWKRTD